MSSYKLNYFNFTGLGEPVRFMLSYAGIDFEDHRIDDDEWPRYKREMPMEQVPVLEIDGKKYYQSMALGRFLAKKANVYGNDDYEALQIDAAVACIDDLRNALATFFWNKEPEWQEKLKKIAFEKLTFYLNKFESLLQTNGGYFFGNKLLATMAQMRMAESNENRLTWADLYFASLNDYLSTMAERDLTADHPNLKKLRDEIYNLPNIRAYLDIRPKTKF